MKISFTGHRPDRLGGYTIKAQRTVEKFASRVVLQLDPSVIIYHGCALGWDMAVAKAAIEQGHRVVSCIPVKGFNSKWSLDSVLDLEAILNKSHEVITVVDGEYDIKALDIRNRFMVDETDELYSLCAGVPSGTLNCVNYAQSKGKSVKHLWRHWLKLKDRL